MNTKKKPLIIRWRRLVNENDQTCPRCGETGQTVRRAVDKLKRALAELDIDVELKAEAMDFSLFTKDPLQSNRIWVAERPLEEWIGAAVGQSRCCDVCGDSECRTLSIGQDVLETIPEDLIVRAGLLAAADLFIQ